MLAGDVRVQVLENPHDPGTLGARAIGRDGHPVHRRSAGQCPHEVGHHHHSALQDAHQQQVLSLVVVPDVDGQLSNPEPNLLFGHEHAFEVGSHIGSVHNNSLRYLYRCRAWTGGERGLRPCQVWAYSTRRTAATSPRPSVRLPCTCPGRSMGPCPRQHVTSVSSESMCVEISAPGEHPASRASSRQTRVRMARGSLSTPAALIGPSPSSARAWAARSSSASASSRSRSAERASAATAPGPSSVSSTGKSLRARTRPNAGSLLCGSTHTVRPAALQAATVVALATPSKGRTYGPRRAGIPDSDRAPEPRARPSRTCSAWSSRVWPSRMATAPTR